MHRNNRYFMLRFTFVKDFFVRRNKKVFVLLLLYSAPSTKKLFATLAFIHCCIAASGLYEGLAFIQIFFRQSLVAAQMFVKFLGEMF